jgi:co-chaperonin GroES (HSP10)
MNEAGLNPCGHRVVVRMDEVERQTAGGIYIPEDVTDREEMSGTMATVIDVGASAWGDQKISGQWAKPGDRVMIAKFAGQLWKKGGVKYRVISDLDVIAVIKEETK